MGRLSKIVVSAVIIGLFLSVFVAFAIGATIADWPEADAWTALDEPLFLPKPRSF